MSSQKNTLLNNSEMQFSNLSQLLFAPYQLRPNGSINSIENKGIHNNKRGFFIRENLSPINSLNDFLKCYSERIILNEFNINPFQKPIELIENIKNEINFFQNHSASEDNIETNYLISNSTLFEDKTERNVNVQSNQLQTVQTLGESLDQAQQAKFNTIKIKFGANYYNEIKFLLKHNLSQFNFRIDFNCTQNEKIILDSYSELKKIPNLEYLEDPCLYQDSSWKNMSSKVALAFDHLGKENLYEPRFSQVIIIKPLNYFNLKKIEKFISEKKKITITNLTDHVVGTLKAAFFHQFLKRQFGNSILVSGLYTHHLFDLSTKHSEHQSNEISITNHLFSNLIFENNYLKIQSKIITDLCNQLSNLKWHSEPAEEKDLHNEV